MLCGQGVDRLIKLQSGERTCVLAREECRYVAERSARASVHLLRRSVSRISITKRKRWWDTKGRARTLRMRGEERKVCRRAGEGSQQATLCLSGRRRGRGARTADTCLEGADAVPCHHARWLRAPSAAAGHIA